MPELESHLINLVQFASSLPDPSSNGETGDPFRRAALNEAAAAIFDVAFEQAATRSSRRRRFMLGMQTPQDTIEAWAVLAAVALLTVVLGAAVPTWASATRRLARPWAFIPTVGSVKIVKVAPGDTEVLMGSGLEVTALVESPAPKNDTATLFVRPKGTNGPETAVRMLPDASQQTFVAALAQVLGPVEYRLQVGDSQTKRYTVGVYERPTVSAVEATYEFPAYLGRPNQTRSQTHADLEAPAVHPCVAPDHAFDAGCLGPARDRRPDCSRTGERRRPRTAGRTLAEGFDDLHDPPRHPVGPHRPRAPDQPCDGRAGCPALRAARRTRPRGECRGQREGCCRRARRRRLRPERSPDRDQARRR